MQYSSTYMSTGGAMPVSSRKEITTTRVREDITTTLTNIDTKSDAWGKVCPMSFGKVRIAGALVWGSQFYKTTASFDDVTTQKSIVTWKDSGQVIHKELLNGRLMVDQSYPTNSLTDVVQSSGSQVTHGESTANFIDLCYSFGTEGDTRRKRYISKIRVNGDTVIYDTEKAFIMDGIAFSVRYGWDNAPPALMEKYPNGKFHYKGQTLVCFDRFPLATFGNSIPNSVDVEFGCCAAPAEDPDNLDVHDSGWPIAFWINEWGSEFLENAYKLTISTNNTQDGGALGYHLNPAWSLGPDVYVTGTAIVCGGDPRFTADLNPVKILDGIRTTLGGAPNGSVWRFSRFMSREAFLAYQAAGGIPFFEGNGVARTGENADAHNENFYQQNTVSFSIQAYSSGKPNIKVQDRLISDTVDTKNTVSLQTFKGKGRTLYFNCVFRTLRGTYPVWVTLTDANGVSWPSFWNGGFTNDRSAGHHSDFLSRGDGEPYYIGAPGEVFTYGTNNVDATGIAAIANSYVYFRNIYTNE